MDAQQLATILAWIMVVLVAAICMSVIRKHSNIDWTASAAFALATLLVVIAAAISASSVLTGGPHLSDEARWVIIITRASATVLFLAVAMDVTGRPRWIRRRLMRRKGG